MCATASKRFRDRFGARVLAAVASVVVIAGVPGLLGAAAARRFHHVSPLHGMNAPWRWSFEDLRSWGRRLTEGLDSSAALVDLFLRVALVIGWLCVAVVLYTVIDEMVFQLRHGMPSARHRHLAGLGPIGRKLATVLMAVLPLVVSATPTLASPHVNRAVPGVVHHRVDDLPEPPATEVAVPTPAGATTDPINGWSVVTVKRGDSIWAIAERYADGGDVAAVADQIVSANLGTMMSDGHRFSTPALIEPGWQLNVPVAGSPPSASPGAPFHADGDYVVVAGDSYWAIAEHHLDATSNDAEVAIYTAELMKINAPLLGYADEKLIRPGDVLQLTLPEPPSILPPPAAVPAADLLPIVTPAIDPVEAPPASPMDTLPVHIEPSPATEQTAPPHQSPIPSTLGVRAEAMIDEWSSNGVPIKRGLAAAVLLSGGALAVLGSRRRHQLRSAHVGARLSPPTDEAIETEKLLRSLTPTDQLARIDLALRCTAPVLARQGARTLAVEVAGDGEIRLYMDRPAMLLADHWILDVDAGAWRLPAYVTLSELATGARTVEQPCPALIHLGESAGGQLFVDLEAVGVLSVDAPAPVAASIVRCAAASLAVSPFAESSRVFTVGIEDHADLGNARVEAHGSLGAAIEALTATVGSITSATSGGTTTFGLRTAAHGGEAWEPSLLLAIGVEDPLELAPLVWRAGVGGRGIGVMIDRPLIGSGASLRAVDGDFLLEPLGRRLTPVGLLPADVAAVSSLLDAADRPLFAHHRDPMELAPTAAGTQFVERPHEIVVQLLGPVAVQSAGGQLVGFDRSKAQELVVWLTQHRHRPTRTSARTALWDLAVRDATFSNVVSDARRAMARAVAPPDGQEWIGRTMNEDLPLHDLVVSDVDLLADRVVAARGCQPPDAITILRPGVALIQGMPFAGTSYVWPDAEGITSSLLLLATSAAGELAAHYLTVGDIDGVFWATGQGLKVLAGHEELIALRMRAHARRGDLAGVRSEWDSYERAINADSWAAAEPSPKLVGLRRELLSPPLAS
jgi:hypothetical protein